MSIGENKRESTNNPIPPRKVPLAAPKGDGIWTKLSNRTRAKKELVAAVSSNAENGWILLKNAQDDILCGIQHETEDEFEAELESIDEQLG